MFQWVFGMLRLIAGAATPPSSTSSNATSSEAINHCTGLAIHVVLRISVAKKESTYSTIQFEPQSG